MKNDHNSNIRCSVRSCRHHCKGDDHCTLETVNIGTRASDTSKCECADCLSFEK